MNTKSRHPEPLYISWAYSPLGAIGSGGGGGLTVFSVRSDANGVTGRLLMAQKMGWGSERAADFLFFSLDDSELTIPGEGDRGKPAFRAQNYTTGSLCIRFDSILLLPFSDLGYFSSFFLLRLPFSRPVLIGVVLHYIPPFYFCSFLAICPAFIFFTLRHTLNLLFSFPFLSSRLRCLPCLYLLFFWHPAQ